MEDNNSIIWFDNFKGGVRLSNSFLVAIPVILLFFSIFAFYSEYNGSNRSFLLIAFLCAIAVLSFILLQASKGFRYITPMKIGISSSGIHIDSKSKYHDHFIPWNNIEMGEPHFFNTIRIIKYPNSKMKEDVVITITPEIAQRIKSRG